MIQTTRESVMADILEHTENNLKQIIWNLQYLWSDSLDMETALLITAMKRKVREISLNKTYS